MEILKYTYGMGGLGANKFEYFKQYPTILDR